MIGLKKILYTLSLLGMWLILNHKDLVQAKKITLVESSCWKQKHVYDTVKQPSEESFYTTQYRNQAQIINAYQFRYLQKNMVMFAH